MATRAEKYRFGLVPKRQFDSNAPLFVTRALKFRGVMYERGQQLPSDISKGKRFALWHSNRATNTPVVYFDRRGRFVADGVAIAPEAEPVAEVVVVAPVEATAESSRAQVEALTDAELERMTAPGGLLDGVPQPQDPSERAPTERRGRRR